VSRSEDAVKRDGAVGASISGYGGGGGVAARFSAGAWVDRLRL